LARARLFCGTNHAIKLNAPLITNAHHAITSIAFFASTATNFVIKFTKSYDHELIAWFGLTQCHGKK
jgi:hypothetical protein